MKRRKFIAGLGGAVAWPLAAQAQQPAMPVVGFLSGRAREESADDVAAFHQGLNKMGYIIGRNVALEYRWGEGHDERLPELTADLVRRRVAVIAAVGGNYVKCRIMHRCSLFLCKSPQIPSDLRSRAVNLAVHNFNLLVPVQGRGDVHEAHHFAARAASMAVVQYFVALPRPVCRSFAGRSIFVQHDTSLSSERRPFRTLAQRAAHWCFIAEQGGVGSFSQRPPANLQLSSASSPDKV